MVMERGLDTGPTIASSAIPILPADTTASLTARLAIAAADLAIEQISRFAAGQISPVAQSNVGASEVRPLTKGDGQIDWSLSSEAIERHVRAMWPWPRAWSVLAGEPMQVHRASLCDGIGAAAGHVVEVEGETTVACGEGAIRLDVVQMPGGKPISGRQWLESRRDRDSLVFDQADADRPPIVRRLN
jgi:methionyl-tRNA formyltransferase